MRGQWNTGGFLSYVLWQNKSLSFFIRRDMALDRALELFNLTVSDARWRHRLKEILRTRECVCDLFYGGNTYNTSFASLEKYFFQFACAVQIKR